MTNEEKQEILEYRMKQRRKHKRCKYCKYKKNISKITYILEDTVDWIFYCPWKDYSLSTADFANWFGFQGCFCRFYEPKELTIDEI